MLAWHRCATCCSVVGALALVVAPPAWASGSFFAPQGVSVTQTAEQVLFADNGDGTTTAVIQIQYEGSGQEFGWLLPLSGVPREGDLTLSDGVAFDRLSLVTAPAFYLETAREGRCKNPVIDSEALAVDPNTGLPWHDAGQRESRVWAPLAGAGVVGDFEWTLISANDSADNPASAALEWLVESDFDIPAATAPRLELYLADGGVLLALRLRKNADVGALRPIVVTYPGRPALPIRLASLVAGQDVGVLVYVVGNARAVPLNHPSLELNETRLNWLRPAETYDDLVTAALREAGGQGFVTEFSGSTRTLGSPLGDIKPVWDDNEAYFFRLLREESFDGLPDFIERIERVYGDFQGFEPAVEAGIENLPDGMTVADLVACAACVAQEGCVPCPSGIEFSQETIVRELEARIAPPMQRVQDLIDSGTHLTRLYARLSPEGVTVDPRFDFNADLLPVPNERAARVVIECNPDFSSTESPWRMQMLNGITVRRGLGPSGQWPDRTRALPAVARLWQYGTSGQGLLVQDNMPGIRDFFEVPERGCAIASAPHKGRRGSLPQAVGLLLLGVLLARVRSPRESTAARLLI